MWPGQIRYCNRVSRCTTGQTWTSCLHSRRLNHVKTIKDGESEGGHQAVQQLFLHLCWTVPHREATLSHTLLKGVSWESAKIKGLTQGPRKKSTFVRLPKEVSFLFSSFHVELSQSVKWLAVILWRPLAGREGRTVLCADVDQALTGLEASQRLAARQRGQGSTQAHHGGSVVLFCVGGGRYVTGEWIKECLWVLPWRKLCCR